MQQQTPPEQCGNPPLQQSVMLCPVQYVYEAPAILPQRQEEQNQRNQILINVKNLPPWIQNRTQNQVVYMQQLPNNYQTYIHPQMIQNPIYHPQMAYQIQPMLAQDNRQFIQIPNLNQYNAVQNPTPQVNNAEPERMPLLTQMLNQKATANRAPNNVVRPNMTPNANTIRPITHNQQVQTDMVSPNIKGRPRNVPPQIITINPMQQQQLTNQKQALINVRPANVRNDVPQHIRTKIPSSISVKSINRPLLPRTLVRPFDVMPAPQNYYYNPIIMPAPNTDAKNTTNQFNMKPNTFQETYATTTVPMQYPIISNVPQFVNMATQKNLGDAQKQKSNVNATVKPNANPVKIQDNNDKKLVADTHIVKNTESQTQTEEKLVRNTVFVQARGRVLNDKEVIQNQNLKRTVDDRIKEETNQKPETNNNARINEEAIHISKKIKVEVTENSSETKEVVVNSPTANLPMNIQTQQSRISNLLVSADNVQKTGRKTPQLNKINEVPEGLNIIKSEESKPIKENKNSQQFNSLEASRSKEKVSVSKESKNSEDIEFNKISKEIKEFNKISNNEISEKVNNNTVLTEETEVDVKKKEDKITVLTHVLDGYIIQESNVAFPIQKPTTDKEIKKEQSIIKSQDQNKLAKKSKKEEGSDETTNENKGQFPWRYLNKSIESEKEMEFSFNDKDDPFAKIKKSTVESWTPDQLASHLEKNKWTETAAKLLDEEIDGESILLVNKDQLVAIGVSEEHAEKIVTFAAS